MNPGPSLGFQNCGCIFSYLLKKLMIKGIFVQKIRVQNQIASKSMGAKSIFLKICWCSYTHTNFGPNSNLSYEIHYVAPVFIRFSIPFSVYDALTGEIVKTLKEQSDCVRDVSWHPYLNELVGSSWDRTIVKWDYKSHDVIGKSIF